MVKWISMSYFLRWFVNWGLSSIIFVLFHHSRNMAIVNNSFFFLKYFFTTCTHVWCMQNLFYKAERAVSKRHFFPILVTAQIFRGCFTFFQWRPWPKPSQRPKKSFETNSNHVKWMMHGMKKRNSSSIDALPNWKIPMDG